MKKLILCGLLSLYSISNINLNQNSCFDKKINNFNVRKNISTIQRTKVKHKDSSTNFNNQNNPKLKNNDTSTDVDILPIMMGIAFAVVFIVSLCYFIWKFCIENWLVKNQPITKFKNYMSEHLFQSNKNSLIINDQIEMKNVTSIITNSEIRPNTINDEVALSDNVIHSSVTQEESNASNNNKNGNKIESDKSDNCCMQNLRFHKIETKSKDGKSGLLKDKKEARWLKSMSSNTANRVRIIKEDLIAIREEGEDMIVDFEDIK